MHKAPLGPLSCVRRTVSDSSDYYDRLNLTLLAQIPQTARHLVDFGCGAGAIGAAFKREVPDCHYVGVEYVPEAARMARSRLDRVVEGDVERMELDALGIAPGSVDCLIYGDILEHLVDPWSLLARHRSLLKPDGLILASIPNVQYWRVLGNLLFGRWRYEDEGVLDRTHLRFFTLDSVIALFEEAGLSVKTVTSRSCDKAEAEPFITTMLPALVELGVDPAAFRIRAVALQWVIVAGLP